MKSSDPAFIRCNGDESTGKVANDKKLDAEEAEHGKEVQQSKCARAGCVNRPRFDSMFCSDSCGVSALELDLLRSFQEGGDIHPSILRS
jgi:hypothetical protein